MKSKSVRLLGASAGVVLVVYLLLQLWPGEKPAVPLAQTAPQPVPNSAPVSVAAPVSKPVEMAPKKQAPGVPEKAAEKPRSGTVRVAIKAGQPIPELFPYQEERDRLLGLASTYDVKNIPLIAPSLKHADSTVRDAARQALIQMGDAAAIPFLENAARSTRDATEAEALRQVIEFLSLPRFMDVVTLGANPPAPTP
jgi:hypothetical protein